MPDPRNFQAGGDVTPQGVSTTPDFSEEELKILMELGVIPGQLTEQNTMLERGMDMQDEEWPEGRTTGANKLYTAANPLEHMAAGLRRYQGGRQQQNALSTANQLRGQQSAGRGAYYNSLMKGR